MDPYVRYYLRQAGRGRDDFGPIYSHPPFMQRGHGIGNFLSGIFRNIRPMIWSGAKSIGKERVRTLGREALRIGGKILSDTAMTEHPQIEARDITSKNLSESTGNIIKKVRGGGGRKRKKRRGNYITQTYSKESQNYKKRCIFLNYISSCLAMSEEVADYLSTNFDIFPSKPVQTSVLESIETSYKTVASIDQSDLEFRMPADSETYLDLDIKLYIRGKLTKADGTSLDDKDFTAGVNNL
jgi:hypothetical protein